MNLYLDASALVKRYLREPGSRETQDAIAHATVVATSLISRAEVSAAFAKSVRVGATKYENAREALDAFRSDWPDLIKLHVTETIVAQSDELSWQHGLRGFDAIHLAAALIWRDSLNEPVAVAAFDLSLWHAAEEQHFGLIPEDLPHVLKTWRKPA